MWTHTASTSRKSTRCPYTKRLSHVLHKQGRFDFEEKEAGGWHIPTPQDITNHGALDFICKGAPRLRQMPSNAVTAVLKLKEIHLVNVPDPALKYLIE